MNAFDFLSFVLTGVETSSAATDSLRLNALELVGETDEATISAALKQILATLTPREERIIRLRYGLEESPSLGTAVQQAKYDMGEGLKLQEIAESYGLSRERIRQLEKKALGKLRRPPRLRQLIAYLSGEESAAPPRTQEEE